MNLLKKALLACVFINLASAYQSGLGFFIDTQLPACVDSAKDSYKSEISDETLQRYCFCMFSFVIDGLSDDELRLLDLASKGKDEGLESEYNSFIGKAIRIGTDMKNVTHCFTKALNK